MNSECITRRLELLQKDDYQQRFFPRKCAILHLNCNLPSLIVQRLCHILVILGRNFQKKVIFDSQRRRRNVHRQVQSPWVREDPVLFHFSEFTAFICYQPSPSSMAVVQIPVLLTFPGASSCLSVRQRYPSGVSCSVLHTLYRYCRWPWKLFGVDLSPLIRRLWPFCVTPSKVSPPGRYNLDNPKRPPLFSSRLGVSMLRPQLCGGSGSLIRWILISRHLFYWRVIEA